jgi:threonine/homoserine/homoserine lactone efflux protein
LANVRVSNKPLRAVVSHGMLNCLLNPKVLLFHLVFIPQFVVPAHGHVRLQLILLGVTMSISGFFFNGAVGATSGHLGAYLSRNPSAARFQGGLLGVVLLGMAIRLITLQRPTPH